MNKTNVIKEVEISTHILKGLIVSLSAILLITFNTVLVFAINTRSGNIVTVSSAEIIDGDLYVAGGTIIIDSTINGDLIIAGRTIMVNGTVNGSIIAAGETVNINGEVTHSVRVMGKTLNISGIIGRDLLVASGEFIMTSTSEIGGDLLLGAGTAHIDGLVKGDINSGINSLTIASTASVQGKLTYTSENEANIQSGAQIRGTINHKLPEEKKGLNIGMSLWWWIFIGFLMTLVLGIIIVLLAPRRVKAITESMRTQPWASLGWGAIILVTTPIVALIVCITIIGLPLGLITLVFYAIAIYTSQLFVGLLIGQLIIGVFSKVETRAALVGALVLGLAILRLLRLIPFVGFFFGLATILFGLGAILVSRRKQRAEIQKTS